MSRSSTEKTPSTQTQDPESAHTSQKSTRKSQSSEKVAFVADQTQRPSLSSSEHETPEPHQRSSQTPLLRTNINIQTQQTQEKISETRTGGATSSGMAPTLIYMEDESESPDFSRLALDEYCDNEDCSESLPCSIHPEVIGEREYLEERKERATSRYQPTGKPIGRPRHGARWEISAARYVKDPNYQPGDEEWDDANGQWVKITKKRAKDPELQAAYLLKLKNTKVKTKDGLIVGKKLIKLLAANLGDDAAEAISKILRMEGEHLGMSVHYVLAEDAVRLIEGTDAAVEQPPKKKIDLKLKKQFDILRASFWGDATVKVEELLDEWLRCLTSPEDFRRPRRLEEVSVGDVEGAEKLILNADASSLKLMGDNLSTFLKTNANEGLKGAYLLGKVVQRYTKLKWTLAQITEELGWSSSHLSRLLELAKLLDDYPLLRRILVPYTTLWKNAKKIRAYLGNNSAAAAIWVNFEYGAGEPSNHYNGQCIDAAEVSPTVELFRSLEIKGATEAKIADVPEQPDYESDKGSEPLGNDEGDESCDFCGDATSDAQVGFSGCGHPEHRHIKICKYCDVDGSNYNGWCDDVDSENDEDSAGPPPPPPVLPQAPLIS